MHSKINKNVRYLDEVDVLVIHAKIIENTGGTDGIRDINLVKAAMARPQSNTFGNELFTTIFEKAAAYFDSITRNHPFIDGNKRTALVLAARFLYLNGYEFKASNEEVERYVLEAVTEQHEVKVIAGWFEKFSLLLENNK